MKQHQGYLAAGNWSSPTALTELANNMQASGCSDQQIVDMVNAFAGTCSCDCCTAARRPSLWRRFLDLLNRLFSY